MVDKSLVLPGMQIACTVGGGTGEVIRKTDWGVLVFDKNRNNEKTWWHWYEIGIRTPRSIKRYPRPLRFPRTGLSSLCHCARGKLEVRGKDVYCTRCKFPIGTESFPSRIKRAENLYCKAINEVLSRRRIHRGVGRLKKEICSDEASNKTLRSCRNHLVFTKGRGGEKGQTRGKRNYTKISKSRGPPLYRDPTFSETQKGKKVGGFPRLPEDGKG